MTHLADPGAPCDSPEGKSNAGREGRFAAIKAQSLIFVRRLVVEGRNDIGFKPDFQRVQVPIHLDALTGGWPGTEQTQARISEAAFSMPLIGASAKQVFQLDFRAGFVIAVLRDHRRID